MVVRKFNRKKRRVRRPYRRRRGTVALVKRVIQSQAEKKRHVLLTRVPEVYWNYSLVNDPIFLQNINMGDSKTGRVGNEIRIQWVSLKLQFHQAVSTKNSVVRVLLVQDRLQSDSFYPTLQYLLQGAGPLTATTAPMTIEYPGRFNVLADKVFFITADKPKSYIRIYRRMNMVTKYSTGSGGAVSKNGLYLYLISDNVALDNGPICDVSASLGYTDI